MSWLEGWSKRIKITVDHDRVDEDLADFPVLVTLADDVGINNADVTDVFGELQSTVDSWSGNILRVGTDKTYPSITSAYAVAAAGDAEGIPSVGCERRQILSRQVVPWL